MLRGCERLSATSLPMLHVCWLTARWTALPRLPAARTRSSSRPARLPLRTREEAVDDVRALVLRLRTPRVDDGTEWLVVDGALTPSLAARLIREGERRVVVVRDPTQIALTGKTALYAFERLGDSLPPAVAAHRHHDRIDRPGAHLRAACICRRSRARNRITDVRRLHFGARGVKAWRSARSGECACDWLRVVARRGCAGECLR